MENLSQLKCSACKGNEPGVTEKEMEELLTFIQNWKIVTQNEVPILERVFIFKNFSKALEFTNRVGELAEEEGHHPSIITEWGRVTVRWWTHKIKGLHRNDFIMASKTDVAFLRGSELSKI